MQEFGRIYVDDGRLVNNIPSNTFSQTLFSRTEFLYICAAFKCATKPSSCLTFILSYIYFCAANLFPSM